LRLRPPVKAGSATPFGADPVRAYHDGRSRGAAADPTPGRRLAAKLKRMKAIVQHRYGPPDQLSFEDVPTPVAKDDEVLLRVRAASVNPYDWYHVTGTPLIARMGGGLFRPSQPIPGVDVAGEVEAVGRDVTQFRPGDAVYGQRLGAYAEYLCVREIRLALKPVNLSFEQAAAVPMAALTALQGLRDKGGIQAGQQVLINGASGGVGTFAVQLAKWFGATVTAVCSTRNVEAAQSLGADRVIDYTREDFVRSGQKYDLMLDIAGNRTIADRRRALAPDGTLVVAGGPKGGKVLGPARPLLKVLVADRFSTRKMVGYIAQNKQEDLILLRDLLESGKIAPVVERVYPLPDVPAALNYVGARHARGKIVIRVS
jgi:NADPH:quinone reductase-like Zn-dependent oxidoreductase